MKDKRQTIQTRLEGAVDFDETEKIVWEAIVAFQHHPFTTVKGCGFTYTVRGNEIKISRKEKTITRSSVDMALQKALELKVVSGPKKLGVFGASYLYPLFLFFGIMKSREDMKKEPVKTGSQHENM